MAFRMYFRCDHERCDQAQEVWFDAPGETWKDVYETIEKAGWKLEFEGSRVTKCTCDEH